MVDSMSSLQLSPPKRKKRKRSVGNEEPSLKLSFASLIQEDQNQLTQISTPLANPHYPIIAKGARLSFQVVSRVFSYSFACNWMMQRNPWVTRQTHPDFFPPLEETSQVIKKATLIWPVILHVMDCGHHRLLVCNWLNHFDQFWDQIR